MLTLDVERRPSWKNHRSINYTKVKTMSGMTLSDDNTQEKAFEPRQLLLAHIHGEIVAICVLDH